MANGGGVSMQRGRVHAFLCSFLCVLCVSAVSDDQEPKNPFAGDPAAIQQGRSVFRLNCSLCHGLDARGGRGPDLTSGRWTHGGSDAALFGTITRGVPGTEMPSADLPDNEVWMIAAYLRSLGGGAAAPLAGNRQAGEKIFFAGRACSQCHMVSGRGGRLGPELSRAGAARSARYLTESIREPAKDISPGYETVTVVFRDGRRITGVRKNEDTFSVQLMDEKEELHFLRKKNLKDVVYEKRSLMPAYDERLLSEKDLQDLLAYLDGLRGR